MPYDTERKLRASEEDIQKVVNMAIWVRDKATLSDNRKVSAKMLPNGIYDADIQADCAAELDPDHLRELAISLIENGKSFIVHAYTTYATFNIA